MSSLGRHRGDYRPRWRNRNFQSRFRFRSWVPGPGQTCNRAPPTFRTGRRKDRRTGLVSMLQNFFVRNLL